MLLEIQTTAVWIEHLRQLTPGLPQNEGLNDVLAVVSAEVERQERALACRHDPVLGISSDEEESTHEEESANEDVVCSSDEKE